MNRVFSVVRSNECRFYPKTAFLKASTKKQRKKHDVNTKKTGLNTLKTSLRKTVICRAWKGAAGENGWVWVNVRGAV
jgi:hypothetical protein